VKFGTKFGVWRPKKKRNTKSPVEMFGELNKQAIQLETAGELNQQIRQLQKMDGVQKIQTLKSYPPGARRKVSLRRLGAVTIIKVILQPGKANLQSRTERAASNKGVNKSLELAFTATKKATFHVNARTKLACQIVQKVALNVVRKVTSLESAKLKAVVIVHQEVMHVSNVAKKGIFPETAQALRLLLEVEEAEAVGEVMIEQALEMSQQ
jgi:hypothetical protein